MLMPRRTRVKICGITTVDDMECAVEAGADAIGLVFYPPSPRYVSLDTAKEIIRHLPAFVTAVGLMVNLSAVQVQRHIDSCRFHILQFHGDETPEFCEQFSHPYIRAVQVLEGFNLLEYAHCFSSARHLLMDAYHPSLYGGGGKTFDWSLIPPDLRAGAILSGGLSPDNVGEGISLLRPFAVDVSSGVECSPGKKDAGLMRDFIRAVRLADAKESGLGDD